MWEVLNQMIHSSRRERKTKAIAEVLAMIADAHPELAPHHPRPVRKTDEWLCKSTIEFALRWTTMQGALCKLRERIDGPRPRQCHARRVLTPPAQ
jgi:hypothetical protein